MAIYKISSSGAVGTLPSVFTNAGDAFNKGTAAADTLIVDPGAFLITTSVNAAAFLSNTLAWTVTVNGSIDGASGINLGSANPAASTITVGADGSVRGFQLHGIDAASSVTIKNAGTIVGQINGTILGGTSHTITNTGTISGGTNSILDNAGNATIITNSGTLNGLVDLAGGTNSLTNTGTIKSGNANNVGVFGGTGNDTISNTKTITGSVSLSDGINKLTNSGTIGAELDADKHSYSGQSLADTVINSGTMAGSVALGGGTNSLTNSGAINGGNADNTSVSGGAGNDTISNTKTISGSVSLFDGTNKLTNSGVIGARISDNASYVGGNNEDTVSNLAAGSLAGVVKLGDGKNTLTNAGKIGDDGATYSIIGGIGNDTITNSGTLTKGIDLGLAGTTDVNKVTNSGTIGGEIVGSEGSDTVTNTKVINGFVQLSNGANFLTNSGTIDGNVLGGDHVDTIKDTGTITGFVDLGKGNDVFTGGAKGTTLYDGDGADKYTFGTGNDTYIATGAALGEDGIDTVTGGTGIDTYDASFSKSSVFVNLDAAFNYDSNTGVGAGIPFLAIVIDKSTATGTAVDGGTSGIKDTVTGFENAIGGSVGDVLIGSAVANHLEGRAGTDDLWGGAGNDTLDGGDNADFIVGGAGRDTLIGGSGGDTFWYFATNESGITAATRDVITDFVAGAAGDVINLSRIDAITTNAANTNDTFTFIGTNVNWGGVAGELRAYWTATGQVIEGDVNGDKKADFSIELLGLAPTIVLSSTNGDDFVL